MSILYGRSYENLNNDCLQKIMGTTFYMGFHVFVALKRVREPSWETKTASRESQRLCLSDDERNSNGVWSRHFGSCTIISVANGNQRILYAHMWCHSSCEWHSENHSRRSTRSTVMQVLFSHLSTVMRWLFSHLSWSTLGVETINSYNSRRSRCNGQVMRITVLYISSPIL